MASNKIPAPGGAYNSRFVDGRRIGTREHRARERALADEEDRFAWMQRVAPMQVSDQTIFCAVCRCNRLAIDLVELECKDIHCKHCLAANVQQALASQPFQPARCCATISPQLLETAGVLAGGQLTDYATKVEEAESPAGRLYCYNPLCGAYIPKANHGPRAGLCMKCDSRTCKTCKAKAHFAACDPAASEANRQANEALYSFAKENGWQACPRCRNVVEREGGCNMMM
ncbi:hypothetical protein F4818DRAFT_452035 [Hypoxylon cercidicola]|nr:hypothetical protein F4818DRAFT_452035 [Hypoxylon cercidicola]